jgi:ABC-type multidrug transport system permease subunit
MRFLWISAVKDLRRLRREPVTLITWIAIPVFLAVILTLVFGPHNSRPTGKLLVADEDGGFGATTLVHALEQSPLSRMVSVEKVERKEGRRRIESGAASALLIIPAGFTGAFLGSAPVKLQLIRNPSQRILPDLIEETLGVILDRAFYAIGAQQSQAQPLIQLQTDVIAQQSEQRGGFAVMLLPGTLYLAVFFVAGALAADVWRERTSGALRRIATTPAAFGAFLGGKLLAAALALGAVGFFGLLLGRLLLDLPIASLPLAVFWISVSGSGLYLMVMLLQSAASSERVANMLTNLVLLPLTMLGGGFVPFDWMPQGMARMGRFTPNGWSVVQLQAILSGSAEPLVFGAAALFLAAAWFASTRVIRRNMC